MTNLPHGSLVCVHCHSTAHLIPGGGHVPLRNCFDFVTENYGFSSDIKCNFSCLWLLIISRTLSFVEAPWCVVAYDEDTGALPHQVSRLYGGYTTAD